MKNTDTLYVMDCIDDNYDIAVQLYRTQIPKKTVVFMFVGYVNAILDLCGAGSIEYEYATKKLQILKDNL